MVMKINLIYLQRNLIFLLNKSKLRTHFLLRNNIFFNFAFAIFQVLSQIQDTELTFTIFVQAMSKILLLFVFAIAAINANKIRKIEMQTSDEPDSGMNHLFGQVTLDVRLLKIQLLIFEGNSYRALTKIIIYMINLQICRSPGICCSTNVLDNPFEDNFQGILVMFQNSKYPLLKK